MSLTPISDDLPRVFTPTRQDPDSWRDVVGDVVRLAQEIAGTEFVPKGIRNSVPATAAAMLYGREVGLPPMTALTSIHVIEGRPGMSAEGMRALVFAAGHEITFDEATGAVCRMRARRAGAQSWTELAWSIDMARAAGLTGKDNWKKYPRAMLIARCTTDLCRMVFPDVIHGFRSTEEIVDMGDEVADTTPIAPPPAGTRRVSRARKSPVERPVVDHELPPPGPPLPVEETPEPEAGLSGPTPAAEGPGGDAPTSSPGSRNTTPDDAGPRMANRAQLRMLHMQWGRLDLRDDRPERLALTAAIIGREIETSNDLTAEEAQEVTATIASTRTADDLRALLAARDDAAATAAGDEADEPLPVPEEET
jgi:hypothetical protein